MSAIKTYNRLKLTSNRFPANAIFVQISFKNLRRRLAETVKIFSLSVGPKVHGYPMLSGHVVRIRVGDDKQRAAVRQNARQAIASVDAEKLPATFRHERVMNFIDIHFSR